LSPSTGDFDPGGKSDIYRAIPSLKECIMIAQDHARVQRYFRGAEGRWNWDETTDLNATIHFDSVGLNIALTEIYDRIEFDPID
jgi:Uma2 family endonuclease